MGLLLSGGCELPPSRSVHGAFLTTSTSGQDRSTAPGRITVVRAAAGTGKTTDLARTYLSFLARGVPADKAIAITFTRRAAAELEERVALALRASLPGAPGQRARGVLGAAWPLYAEVAPTDPEIVTAALTALPNAPIGTTDRFVLELLTEMALDAALPVPEGPPVPLDVPLSAAPAIDGPLRRAAVRLLDQPDGAGAVDPDVAALTRYLTLDQLRAQVVALTPWDDLPLARTAEVLGTFVPAAARAVLSVDLGATVKVTDPHSPSAWIEALDGGTNAAGKWALPEVAAWLGGPSLPEEAPYALLGWLVALHLGRKAGKLLKPVLDDDLRDCGPARLTLWEIVRALRYPYDDPEQVRRVDALREARERLRVRVVARGLENAARAGELGYDQLLTAATELCRAPPERLRGRFSALLVDEVQDASPDQLRLYRALAALDGVESYFVGDSRQSIYLFRHAEPTGLRDLETEAGATVVDLGVNRRSAPRLVDAHRALFARLDAPMRENRWQPLDSLEGVAADDANTRLALDPDVHAPDAPFLVVTAPSNTKADDLDERTLRAFFERVQAARSEPGHAGDTAAVLTPVWKRASDARDRLRAWSGRSDIAFVEGATGRKSTRVGDDVELFLTALLDESAEAHWFGVWKHPSVGLSDAALARIVAGVGLMVARHREDGGTDEEPAAAWARRPGLLLAVDHLADPHSADDQRAYLRAIGPLREAKQGIGRGSTARVLDRVWSALGWRAVLAAGPGGVDEVAELEVVLDRIRDWDAEGRPADWILEALREDQGDRPQVHVRRDQEGGPPVACTTVFQAKGLAWDHVCVLGIGEASGGIGRDVNRGWMRLGDRDVRLDGLRIDPRGGLSSFRDPLGRLAAAVRRSRANEECARLAYVAVTRARRSVTVGIAAPPAKKNARKDVELHEVLAEVWLAEPAPAGVAVVARPAGAPPGPRATGWVKATGAPLDVPSFPPAGWVERAPSAVGAHLARTHRERHAARVASLVRLGNGLHPGRAPLVPPAIPIRATDWGEIVHGWLERWQFKDDPDPAAVADVLARRWGSAPPDVVAWITAVSRQLREVGGPIWDRVCDPKARLLFEHPFVGVGRAGDDPAAYSGRMDLLIERKGRFTVVDFKAGARSPTSDDDLVEAAGLRTYAFQLHAYADALRGIGHPVEEVALWFVRTGTSVRWTP